MHHFLSLLLKYRNVSINKKSEEKKENLNSFRWNLSCILLLLIPLLTPPSQKKKKKIFYILYIFTFQAVEIENAAGGNVTKGIWAEQASFNISAPDCREAHWSRDNHLGNGVNGQTNNYNWTIPETIHERCALRLRWVL